MIILYLNCQGLANTSKKLDIRHLLEIHNPSTLMIQETMMDWGRAIKTLFVALSSWYFLATNAQVRSGGLLTDWKKNSLQLQDSWEIQAGLGTSFLSIDLNMVFLYLNIYVLYVDPRDF
jgi:hypothetical protein